MGYQKIEIVVFSEEADGVVVELNSAIDRLGETYEIFGGDIEISPVEHTGVRRKSTVRHTIEAGNTAISAVRMAVHKVAGAYKKVI